MNIFLTTATAFVKTYYRNRGCPNVRQHATSNTMHGIAVAKLPKKLVYFLSVSS